MQAALRARDAVVAGTGAIVPAGTNASSTDSNVPIALGIPAVTIDGGGQGRGAHSLSEAYNDGNMGWAGPQFALLLVTALAGMAR